RDTAGAFAVAHWDSFRLPGDVRRDLPRHGRGYRRASGGLGHAAADLAFFRHLLTGPQHDGREVSQDGRVHAEGNRQGGCVGGGLGRQGSASDSGPAITIQRRKQWAKLAGGVVALLVMALVAAYFVAHPRHSRGLTDKDTLVLADFTNTTGDAVFDGTLRQGLAVQLEQSPFLSLVSDERVQQVLRLMGQPPDSRLTPEIAREICQRTASAAVLYGSIGSLGSQYVLGLK